MNTSDQNHLQDVSTLLSQLQQIATSVIDAASADTLGEVLQRIADVSRLLVRAKYSALGVPDGSGSLEFFEVSGISAEDASRISHPPIGRGLLGAIMLEREPIRLENLQADPRSIGFPPNHPPMTRFLGVPIIAGSQLFGMFYLTDPLDGEPFSDTDQSLIETTAGYAALAIAGARLRDQQRRLALLEERERISMDLHDGVIQSLYAIGMTLDLMRLDLGTQADELNAVIHSLNDVIEDIRATIHDLKWREQPKTILGCLQEVIARLHVPNTLRVDLNAPAIALPFDANTNDAICQIAHEAISNVIRHAKASHLAIYTNVAGDRFELRIMDDGVGFNAETAGRGEGLGLHNMRQRALLHGGSVDVESVPEGGTAIILVMPINPSRRR